MNVKKSEIFRAVALAMILLAPVACMAGKCITALVCSVSAFIAGRIGGECASEEVPPWFKQSTVNKTNKQQQT
jgi:hypothetical protein